MGRAAIIFACLALFAGVAAAQGDVADVADDVPASNLAEAAGAAGRSYQAGGAPLNFITCTLDGNRNVASVSGATCSPGTTALPTIPASAITRVVVYRGTRRAAASTSTINRLIARIEFYSGGTLAGACGEGFQTGASRQYTYNRNGATNLAAISTTRCRGSGIAFAGIRLGWTNQAFTPFRRPSPPPAPLPRPPPPPTVPASTVEVTLASTFVDKPCTPENIASVNNSVAAYYDAVPGVDVTRSVTSCAPAPGRKLQQVFFVFQTIIIVTSPTGQNIVTVVTTATIVLEQQPQLIGANQTNGNVNPIPPVPSPPPPFAFSPPPPYVAPRH